MTRARALSPACPELVEIQPLQDLCERIMVGIASAATHAYRQSGTPMIRNMNIKEGHIDIDNVLHLDPAYEHQHRNKRLKAGDVVVVRTGNPGIAAVVPRALDGAQCFTSLIIRPRREELDPEYLSAYINSSAGQRQFLIGAAGGAQKNVNAGTLARMTVPVPPMPRQHRVIAASRSLDRLGRDVAELISAKRTFRRGLVQQLLTGKKRFPEFQMRPWHHSPLGTHVVLVNRKNDRQTKLVLTASGEHGLVDQRTYFNRNVAGVDLSRYYLLRRGEFAYNRSAMNGYPYGATKRLDSHDEGVLSTLYLCFAISDPQLDSDFLRYVFDSGLLNRQLRPIVRVGARAHGLLNVTDEDFLSISIPLPSVDEQRRIAGLLRLIDQELGQLELLRDRFELQRREMLTRLLSCGGAVKS
jgi:type I restriction enzyme S subunit